MGGGSGGSILLVAPSVTVNGILAANGGAGGTAQTAGTNATANDQPALGPPSAGIGSAAATLNGGSGVMTDGGAALGGGGGGAGRIRINTMSGAATLGPNSVISPALGTACATQGNLD
jgi:hypothetical protein